MSENKDKVLQYLPHAVDYLLYVLQQLDAVLKRLCIHMISPGPYNKDQAIVQDG